jgi:hypothetical protein
MTTNQPWPWPPETDALLAAPASHRVLMENEQVRILEVVIEPGAREPEHTHQVPSVMIIDSPARIRYYADGGTLQFESEVRPTAPAGPRVRWMEPEGPHSVENIDQHRYHAIRVELKQHRPANPAVGPVPLLALGRAEQDRGGIDVVVEQRKAVSARRAEDDPGAGASPGL